MVIQYPHNMNVYGTTGVDSVQDASGQFEAPAPVAPSVQACRYEPLARIREIKTADGNVVESRGVVYMPLSAADIQPGTMIEIPGVIKTPVLYFYRGQMNCTINL